MTDVSYPKGIKEVGQRILKAAQKGEKIIIYGDADLDGIASVVILKELFDFLNPLLDQQEKIRVYFPDREKEGYGISDTALDVLAQEAPALLFVLDCGISNVSEVERAKKTGFEVVIIDHHQPLEKLPKADLLIDPKLKDDPCPFKDYAAAGLVYKVAQSVLSRVKDSESVEDKLSELAALATLSDQMPLKEDNRRIVDKGMSALLNTQREGILALIDLGEADVQTDMDVFQKIIAPLNSANLMNHVAESYLLLTEDSPRKARTLAQKLIKQNKHKKGLVSNTVEELIQKIDKEKSDSLIIFEVNEYWTVPALGVIASKLLQFYKKPIFLFKKGEKESVGSARLPSDLDGVAALTYCKRFLETYGGHAPACGCRLKNKNLDKFKKCLEKYFSKQVRK